MSFLVLLVVCTIPQFVFTASQSVSCAPGVPGVPGVPGLNGKDGSKGDQGAAGPTGDKGAMGPMGPKGEQGAPGGKGEQGAKAMQKNWKQCAWKALNDGRDYGLIKECVFNKLADNSALKVEFNGDYRICCCLDCCKRWYFTFNGNECGNPMAIDGIAHISLNQGRTDTNIHRTTQIGGYCEGIPKGNVRVGFNVGDCVGKKSGSDAYTGWNSVTRIMIEEVPPPQP